MALRMGEERAADSGAERHGVSALDVVPVLIATALWSSSAILIDRLVAVDGMTPLQISAWRAAIATLVVAAVMVLFQPRTFRIGMRDLPVFAAAGVIGISLSYITWAASVQTNKPAVAASLSFSYPAFVAIGATVLFGARQRPMAIAAIMVNLVGCALVAGILSPA
ncbi:MAG TPA: DMT family transporter, partial [Chloroflexota bacterium]